MESLEKYIRKNRDSFDEKEPLEGHFDRFRQKLETRKPAKKVNLFLVAAAAAVAGLVLTGTLGVLYNNSSISNFNQKGVTANVIPAEMNEVETYYKKQISEKYSLIDNLSKKASPEVASEIKVAIHDMDLNYYLLKKEFINNPQERVMNALIQQYQIRIDMLDKILTTLQSNTNSNNLK